MKKKKGITLIELLAVIVILAIISLIETPTIMNVLNNAGISTFKDPAYGIISAGGFVPNVRIRMLTCSESWHISSAAHDRTGNLDGGIDAYSITFGLDTNQFVRL